MTRIFIAMPDALLVFNRSGGGWQVDRRLEVMPTQCIAVDTLRPERMYCGTFGKGLWRSDDAAASWQAIGRGISRPQITAVAVSKAERSGEYGVVYAGTEPTTLYRSEDGGDSWHDLSALGKLPSSGSWSFPPRPYTSHVRAIALDPNVEGRLFIAVEAGALVRSLDGGQTWQDRKPDGPFDSHTLAMHPLAPDRVYSAAGDGFMAPGKGYVESLDGGDTWQRPGEGIRFNYLWGLAVDPSDPETMVVSGAPSPNQAHNPTAAESAVYRRVQGQAWQEIHEGLPDQKGSLAFQLAANEAEPGVFYAANNLGIYRSPDTGLSWERLDVPWPDSYMQLHVEGLLVTGA